MSDLSFSVRVGIPGSLTIEIQPTGRILGQKPETIYPPLRESVTALGPSAAGIGTTTPGQQASVVMGKAWGQGWAQPVSRRLNALGGYTNFQTLFFQAPSLDQTDNAWGGTATIDATTDPVTVTATLFGTSNYGRSFQVGDYIIWDDATVVNGKYSYEIDLITAVSGATLTLQRQGVTPGLAQFNSQKTAHAGMNFYQLVNPSFTSYWDGSWQVFKYLWDNMIVAAVSGTTWGATGPSIVNLSPVPPAIAYPGLPT